MLKKTLVLASAAAAVGAVAVPALGASRTVAVRDEFFSPRTTSVARGTTVTFAWRGEEPHNVTVVSGPVKFRSRTITRGTFRKTFTRAGTYRIVCTLHDGMHLTLKVR
jgi:plastocyanin